ncbi:MAG: (2Fe-2S)-binding protein [Oscillospiraceae bacterium]|nr:(2Fe-2S)-binding protein [Oscillospiraceae bacterium]MDD4368256.1 (2Fe-2S)-binding protein [Oscillospiraceae bacterium]
MNQRIAFKLNGQSVVYEGSAADRLLDVLRQTYRLTGVKCGCNEGECGACSVLIDGHLANSCMVAMGRVANCEVTTIEGFSQTKRFEVLERAYAAVSAVQCGYCIPGMILASECVLARHPHPTETEIRSGLSGNLCRCTGYNAIVQAIQIAAREGEGLW